MKKLGKKIQKALLILVMTLIIGSFSSCSTTSILTREYLKTRPKKVKYEKSKSMEENLRSLMTYIWLLENYVDVLEKTL